MSRSDRKKKRYRSKQKDTRMKYIKVPEEVELTTVTDDKVRNGQGELEILNVFQFIRLRLADPKFPGEDKKGYDGALFVQECKDEIDGQKDEEGLEVLQIENEFYKRLVAVMKDPTVGSFDSRWSYSMVPLMKAIMDATDKHPDDIKAEEEEKAQKAKEKAEAEAEDSEAPGKADEPA